MEKKLDIPYLMNIASYDLDAIVQHYRHMADILGEKNPDFQEDIKQTQQAIKKTLDHVGDMPIILDALASCQPFGMAKGLLRYGFNVQAIFFVRMNDEDKDDRKWVEDNCPQVAIGRIEDYDLVTKKSFGKECIGIGFDCAYLLKTQHFVDIVHDGAFHGFEGVRRLMQSLYEAHDTTADWEYILNKDRELQKL